MILPENVKRLMSPEERKKLGKAGELAAETLARVEIKCERDLQKLISNELNRRGYYVTNASMRKKTTTPLGTPDFIVCINSQYVAIEVKYDKGKLRKEQVEALAQIERNGGKTATVRTFDEFRAFLACIESRSAT